MDASPPASPSRSIRQPSSSPCFAPPCPLTPAALLCFARVAPTPSAPSTPPTTTTAAGHAAGPDLPILSGAPQIADPSSLSSGPPLFSSLSTALSLSQGRTRTPPPHGTFSAWSFFTCIRAPNPAPLRPDSPLHAPKSLASPPLRPLVGALLQAPPAARCIEQEKSSARVDRVARPSSPPAVLISPPTGPQPMVPVMLRL